MAFALSYKKKILSEEAKRKELSKKSARVRVQFDKLDKGEIKPIEFIRALNEDLKIKTNEKVERIVLSPSLDDKKLCTILKNLDFLKQDNTTSRDFHHSKIKLTKRDILQSKDIAKKMQKDSNELTHVGIFSEASSQYNHVDSYDTLQGTTSKQRQLKKNSSMNFHALHKRITLNDKEPSKVNQTVRNLIEVKSSGNIKNNQVDKGLLTLCKEFTSASISLNAFKQKLQSKGMNVESNSISQVLSEYDRGEIDSFSRLYKSLKNTE